MSIFEICLDRLRSMSLTLETMAEGGEEQAASRALAEAAQEMQGRMFDTHHQWLKQNEELISIAAEQNLALKLAERLQARARDSSSCLVRPQDQDPRLSSLSSGMH